MEKCSTGSALGTVAQDQPIYIFLLVIVIDYISNVIPLLSFPSSALSGISGREGPWSCGGLMPQHRRKLGLCDWGIWVCGEDSSQKHEKGQRDCGSKILF